MSPESLTATVNLSNLFGTPAENRRVTRANDAVAGLPAVQGLSRITRSTIRRRRAKGFNEPLQPAKTDENGRRLLDLNLQRFAQATYRLHLAARASRPMAAAA